MAVTGAINFQVAGGQTTLFQTVTAAATTAETQINLSIAASTTNQLLPISIDISQITEMYIYTDGALTIKTNSSGAPDDTFVFGASGAPLVYMSTFPTVDGVSQNPFDADVTAFYLTNAGSAAVAVNGVILQNI